MSFVFAGYLMLGLGDIVLPGLLLGLAHRLDTHLNETDAARTHRAPAARAAAGSDGGDSDDGVEVAECTPSMAAARQYLAGTGPHLRAGVWGYVAGMCMAMVASIGYGVAQPALLYLVPCTIVAVAHRAWRGARLRLLWAGVPALESELEREREFELAAADAASRRDDDGGGATSGSEVRTDAPV